MTDVDRLASLLAANDLPAARELAIALAAMQPAAAAVAHAAIAAYVGEPARAKVQLAALFLMAGNRQRAIASAREALAIDSSAAIKSSVGGLLVAAGEDAEAMPLLQKAIAEKPDDPRAHENLATAAFHAGDIGAAMTGYARAFDLAPSSVTPIHSLIEMFCELGKWTGALTALEQCRAGKPPPEVAVAVDLAAIQILSNLAGQYPGPSVDAAADTTVRELVANAGKRPPRVQLVIARALFDIERFNEAAKIARTVSNLRILDAGDRAELHYVEGLLAEHDEYATTAIERYMNAVNADPTRVDAAANVVSLLLERGTDEALAQIDMVLERVDSKARSSAPALSFNEARYHVKRERKAEARVCLERVLQLSGGEGDLADLTRAALAELGS